MAYVLTSKSFGVYFNDNSKLILDPNNFHFDYHEKNLESRREANTSHTLQDFPDQL